jgi:hypothetical protein
MNVCRWWGDDAAFYDVLMAEEGGFGFAGPSVPKSCGLVVTC